MPRKSKDSECYAALYERLSRDDDLEGDSNSIINQKRILSDYARQNGFTRTRHYTDDGWSGANFERPDWKRLLEDIEKGEIDTVIVKDMSRIGRDYLQVGFYTEVVFRQKGIRFIAIANSVDSERQESAEFAPFLNIMNEWYVRDCSRKIKTAVKTKGMSGAPISVMCPYGYKKDPDHKNHWLVDEEVAWVVKKIFQLAMEGNGPVTIAKILESEHIERPSYYFGKQGIGNWQGRYYSDYPYAWKGITISQILDRPEYAGHTVNFRTHKESYKDKRQIPNDRSEWKIFENTHEAIVDEDTFNKVQELRHTVRKRNSMGEMNVLTGKVFCADCGQKMYYQRRRPTKTWSQTHPNKCYVSKPCSNYICSSYVWGNQNYKPQCSPHLVIEDGIRAVILETLKRTRDFALDNEEAFRQLVFTVSSQQKKESLKKAERRLKKNEKRQGEISLLIRRLYEDNISGKLSEENMSLMLSEYEAEQKKVMAEIDEDRNTVAEIEEDQSNVDKFINLIRKYTEFEELTPIMINEFVSKVVVHTAHGRGSSRTQEIDVYLNYVGCVTIPREEEILTPEEEEKRRKEAEKLEKNREYHRRYAEKKRHEILAIRAKMRENEETAELLRITERAVEEQIRKETEKERVIV